MADSRTPTLSRRGYGWLVVGAPCCLYLAIAVPLVNRTTLFRDELATREFSALPLAGLMKATSHLDRVFLPYYFLMHIWRLLGDGPVMMRVPSVAAGLVTVGVSARIADRLWGRPAGVVAGAALALNSSFVDTSLIARPYSISLMLCAIGSLVVVRALTTDRGDAGTWRCYSVVISLAILMQIFAVLIVISHLIPVLVSRSSAELRRFGSAVLVPVLLAGVILVVTHGQSDQVSWISKPSPRNVIQIFRGLTGESGYALLLIVAVGISAAVRARPSNPDGFWLMAVALLTTPIVALYAVSLTLSPILVNRYTITVQFATALLLGAAVESISQLMTTVLHQDVGQRLVAGVAVVLVGAVIIVSVADLRTEIHRRYRVDDWPALVGFLSANTHAGDVVVVSQAYDQGGFAAGEPYYAGDEAFSKQVVADLPNGDPTLFFRDVVQRAPLRTGADPRRKLDATTWLVGLGGANSLPAGFDDLAARGCRLVDRSQPRAVTHIGDILVARLTCYAN